MRKIITFILFLSAVVLNAQETALFRVTYDCDALYSKTRNTYRWFLDVGKTQSVFYNPNNRAWTSEYDNISKEADIATALVRAQNVNKKYGNKNSLEVLTGAPSSDKYTYMRYIKTNKFIYTEKLPQIDWALSDSTKTICDYQCKKAVATVYGRTWTVWYTPDIPVSAGPYVLKGLPGVILEACDADNLFHFVAVGLEQNVSDARIELFEKDKALKCSRSKFLKLRKSEEGKTYGEAVKELGINLVKAVDINGKDITNTVQPTSNYLDLE